MLSVHINRPDKEGKPPLIRALEAERCSVENVRILLSAGADPNYRVNENYPLSTALVYCRDEAVVRLLLNAGANPNKLFYNRSLLCIALEFNTFDVVQLFLTPDSPLTTCRRHDHAVFCAISHCGSKSCLEALNLLFENDRSLLNRLEEEDSTLCFALSHNAKADLIELLINAGASLTCPTHTSLFHCLMKSFSKPFRASVVKILLRIGANPNIRDRNGLTPLQCALQQCEYEPEAIELLLLLLAQSARERVNNGYLLHYAVSNQHCKLSVLKQLRLLGADIEKPNVKGNTPLHLATEYCHARIIEYLVENGCKPNVKNTAGETPMMVAIHEDRGPDILRILFLAYSHLEDPVLGDYIKALMDNCAFQYHRDRHDKTVATINMLLKFSFLENLDEDIEEWISSDVLYTSFRSYAQDCKNELQTIELNHGAALHSYLRGYSLGPDGPNTAYYDLDQLLKIRVDKFPIFFDIFVGRVGRKTMISKMEKLTVYAVKKEEEDIYVAHGRKRLKRTIAEKKIILPSFDINKICQCLSDADMMRFLLASRLVAESGNVSDTN